MNKTIIISGTWEKVQEKLNRLKKKYGSDTPISVFIENQFCGKIWLMTLVCESKINGGKKMNKEQMDIIDKIDEAEQILKEIVEEGGNINENPKILFFMLYLKNILITLRTKLKRLF